MATLPSHNPFPSTAMHKVFNLNDIVRLITDNIPHGELKSAVALACCCESISGPALDSLWRRQTDLGTLLVRLPPPTWKVVNNEFVSAPSFSCRGELGAYSDPGFPPGTLRGTMGPVFYLRSPDAYDYRTPRVPPQSSCCPTPQDQVLHKPYATAAPVVGVATRSERTFTIMRPAARILSSRRHPTPFRRKHPRTLSTHHANPHRSLWLTGIS